MGDWKAFINTLDEFKFPRGQYSEESSDTSGKFVSVCRTIKSMFPNDGEEMNKNYARVLQWFFGHADYTFFTFARRNDFDTFHAHCCFVYMKKHFLLKKVIWSEINGCDIPEQRISLAWKGSRPCRNACCRMFTSTCQQKKTHGSCVVA